MGRFHQSMSWNHPTESGEMEAKKQPSDKPWEVSKVSFRANDLKSAFESGAFDGSSAEHDFLVEPSSKFCLPVRFFLPLHYTASYDYPLIVWFHSNGFNENQVDHVIPHISLRNYIAVGIRGPRAADSMGHRFDWYHSPAAIAAAHQAVVHAVDQAIGRFSIHESRIILAGYRGGGTMALRIAMRQPDRFAAAVSLGGRMPQGAIRNFHELRRRRMPMLWQWGSGNPDYTEETLKSDCRLSMAMGGQVEVRQYPGDDEMDTVALRDVDDWIMRRIISNSSVAESDSWATSPTLYSSN